MPTVFSIAHLSDPHLPAVPPKPGLMRLLAGGGKRGLGFLSWKRRRYAIHRAEMLDLSLQDIAARQPDHVLVGGDLVNLALAEEFTAATAWLQRLGAPHDVSLVPGNHDALVRLPPRTGMGAWQPWMTGDDGQPGFPWLRLRGPFALVGASSAVPTPPFMATGRLGAAQLQRLRMVLERAKALAPICLLAIHHPPVLGHGGPRKGLSDRAALAALLREVGVDAVLHGHHHRTTAREIAGPRGPIPVLGAASASSSGASGTEAAGWWHLQAVREGDGWRLSAEARGWRDGGFHPLQRVDVPINS